MLEEINKINQADNPNLTFQKIIKGINSSIFSILKKNNNEYNVLSDTYKEMLEIKKKAIENGTFMKAPNGSISNLPEKQRLLVRTKKFKSRFGDREKNEWSKILDKNHEPKIYYHGTNKNNIKIFRIDKTTNEGKKDGIFFTSNKKVGKEYSIIGKTYETFINIRNPIEIDFGGKSWCKLTPQEIAKLFHKPIDEIELIQMPSIVIGGGIINSIEDSIQDIKNTFKQILNKPTKKEEKYYAIDDIVKFARHYGYDGVISHNIKDIGKYPSLSKKTRNILHDQIVILDPNQVKSIDNNGAFSTTYNNITE